MARKLLFLAKELNASVIFPRTQDKEKRLRASRLITATGQAEGCTELLALEENQQWCLPALLPLWAEPAAPLAAPPLGTCSVPAFATRFQPALRQQLLMGQVSAPGLPTARAPRGLTGQRGLALTCSAVRHQLADFALHSSQGLSSRLLGQQPDAFEVVEGQQVLRPVALGKRADRSAQSHGCEHGKMAGHHLHGEVQAA